MCSCLPALSLFLRLSLRLGGFSLGPFLPEASVQAVFLGEQRREASLHLPDADLGVSDFASCLRGAEPWTSGDGGAFGAFLLCCCVGAFRGASSVWGWGQRVCTARYWVSLRPVTGSNVLVAYFVTGAGRVMARLPEEEAVSRVLALLKLGCRWPFLLLRLEIP